MQTPSSFAHLSDQDLLQLAKRLAGREREATVTLIASLMEIDARRLYLGEGSASLFAYCTRALHLSEHAAYHRIEAARAARRFPVILDLLADGSMTLTNVTLLAPHLMADNAEAVLGAARHKTKREVERQVAALAPRPDVPASIRTQPAPAAATPAAVVASEVPPSVPPGGPAPLPAPGARPAPTLLARGEAGHTRTIAAAPAPSPAPQRPVVAPLSADRYKVQVTVSGETIEKLRRIQDLMRHSVPDGDPAAIVDRALTLLLAHLERTRLAATAVRAPAGWRRLARGTFRQPSGARCGAGTRGSAPSSVAKGSAAASGAFSSSIISSRMRWAARPRSTPWPSGAVPIIGTRPSRSSACCHPSYGKYGRRTLRLWGVHERSRHVRAARSNSARAEWPHVRRRSAGIHAIRPCEARGAPTTGPTNEVAATRLA